MQLVKFRFTSVLAKIFKKTKDKYKKRKTVRYEGKKSKPSSIDGEYKENNST